MVSCVQKQPHLLGNTGEAFRLQTIHDASYKFDQVMQHWHNAPALEGHPLSERYERHGLTIICNFEVLMPLKGSGSGVRSAKQPAGNLKHFASLVYRSNSIDIGELPMGNQEPMFVFNVEVVEVEKNLTLPSYVGLYGISHESLNIFSGVLFESVDGSFKAISGFAGRELSVLGALDTRSTPGMIESDAQVMERVSEDCEQDRVEWLSRGDAEYIVSGFRICLYSDTVRIILAEDLRPHVQLLDVLFGPCYF